MEIPPHSLKAQLSPGNYTLVGGHTRARADADTQTRLHSVSMQKSIFNFVWEK